MIDHLETERLLLRPWQESDLDAYASMCAVPEVMRYLGGKPFSRLETWRHMAFMIGHWQLRGYGHFAVELKATGEFIGRLGFLNPAGWPGFEIGWTLGRQHWGQGYASEAARIVLPYGFNDLDQPHIISLIHPDNERSKQVAIKLGARLEGQAEILGIAVEVYGIAREDYRAKLASVAS